MTRVAFTVYGKAEPAGSKKGFPIRRGDKIGVVITDANPKSKGWQGEVRAAAGGLVEELMSGPLRLDLTFVRARPRSHYGSGRNAAVVKPSAPAFPITKPDSTKLTRGVEDALTGVIWGDDAQIVSQHVHKVYGAPEACYVEVETIPIEARIEYERSVAA